jgi:uncharacterized protein YggU (UPF0235/DUF167 family)
MGSLDIRSAGELVLVALRVRSGSRPGMILTESGLVIRVASPPEKGRATEEARRALARALELAPLRVSLRSGATARRKVFAVEGVDAVTARRRLLEAASP